MYVIISMKALRQKSFAVSCEVLVITKNFIMNVHNINIISAYVKVKYLYKMLNVAKFAETTKLFCYTILMVYGIYIRMLK